MQLSDLCTLHKFSKGEIPQLSMKVIQIKGTLDKEREKTNSQSKWQSKKAKMHMDIDF